MLRSDSVLPQMFLATLDKAKIQPLGALRLPDVLGTDQNPGRKRARLPFLRDPRSLLDRLSCMQPESQP
jgi:hypothetical protein